MAVGDLAFYYTLYLWLRQPTYVAGLLTYILCSTCWKLWDFAQTSNIFQICHIVFQIIQINTEIQKRDSFLYHKMLYMVGVDL